MFTSKQLTTEKCTIIPDQVGSVPIEGSKSHVTVHAFRYDSEMKTVSPQTISAPVPVTSRVFKGETSPGKQWCFVVDRNGKATLREVTANAARRSKAKGKKKEEETSDVDSSMDALDATEDLDELKTRMGTLEEQNRCMIQQIAQLTALLETSLQIKK